MGTYSIKDLERLSQVKAHTIRIWEKRYDLLRPKRSDTNIRSYSDEDLRRLLNVALLSANGVKISRIANLSAREIDAKVLEISSGPSAHLNEVDALVLAMTNFDEGGFERIISNAVLRMGFESTMHLVLLPFLDRVGVLWQGGAIRPGQEHFVSNIIRQKLVTAIDALVPPSREDRRKLVLFLPEGELHELGLLFGQYLAVRAGHRVIYLGQSVPMPDLLAIVKHHKPDALVTAFITSVHADDVRVELRRLSREMPGTTIMAHVGSGTLPKGLPVRVQAIPDLKAFAEFLA